MISLRYVCLLSCFRSQPQPWHAAQLLCVPSLRLTLSRATVPGEASLFTVVIYTQTLGDIHDSSDMLLYFILVLQIRNRAEKRSN